MSDGNRIPYTEAKQIADSLVDLLKPYCEEISIAGSVRREKDTIGDIELVALPGANLLTEMDKMIASGVFTKADYGGSTRWGSTYRGVLYQGVKCEVFLYDEHNRGYIQWLRTGPGDANTQIMVELGRKRAPYRFIGGYCYYAKRWSKDEKDNWFGEDRALIPVPDEKTLFTLLGMKYLEPEARTAERYARAFASKEHYFGFKPHVCRISTARVNTDHPAKLDITVKSASTDEGKVLAPTWELVMGHKDGALSDAEYTEQYLTLLRGRYAQHKQVFLNILKRDEVVLTCYCAEGDFCHRLIAVDVLKKIARSEGILVHDCGEIQPEYRQMEMFG